MTIKFTQVVVLHAVVFDVLKGATALAVKCISLKHLNHFVGLNERMSSVCTASTPVDRLFFTIHLRLDFLAVIHAKLDPQHN